MLLVLYMSLSLKFNDHVVYGIYGSFVALIYLTPMIGGIMADRLLKNSFLMRLGAISITVGGFVLVYQDINAFYFGLGITAIGYGLFKPNLMRMMGRLYDQMEFKREAGFTLFFVGSNLGAAATALVSGYIGNRIGWHYAFFIAATVMLLNLILIFYAQKRMTTLNLDVRPESLTMRWLKKNPKLWGILSVPFFGLLFAVLLSQQHFFFQGIMLTAIVITAYTIVIAFKSTSLDRKLINVILILVFFHLIFFAFFEQLGNSMNLFVERSIERTYLGFQIPTTWFQSLNPLYVILIGPLISALWLTLSYRGRDISIAAKFFGALLFLSAGFGLFTVGAFNTDCDGKVSILWLLFGILCMTIGEVLIAPVAMSTITRISPKGHTGYFIGLYFLSVSFGNYISGFIAKLMAISPDENGQIYAVECAPVYGGIYGKVALAALGASLLLLIFAPFLKKTLALKH
ncbi:hypothetical protein GQ61_07530 [Candidatus Nucleicultrix amoebiphila FS5]|uniref:Major facilitator superfamily (MFS) profile domain-containing protein n=2 Tax=Candidatus Nucleicultrix TaxID=1509243 RepID=A0A1W6N5N1_9PROT|nr:hypothetical protein GQ61_07530 [Candidatus Nucleicultrix amoebiphila FS5]